MSQSAFTTYFESENCNIRIRLTMYFKGDFFCRQLNPAQ
jgi:hypothetical protein